MLDCPATCQGLLLQTNTPKKAPSKIQKQRAPAECCAVHATPARALNHSVKTVPPLADVDQMAVVLVLC